MKLKNTFTVGLIALGTAVALHGDDSKASATPATTNSMPPAAAGAPATPAAPQYTEPQLLETFGWYIGKRSGLSDLGFTKDQAEFIVKGIIAAAEGKESPYDLQKIGPEMAKFMKDKQQLYMAKQSQKSVAEADKFMKDVKAKPGVTTLPDGLAFEIVQPGTGAYPKPTDTVKVQYTGTLVDGTKFDSSLDHGEPAEFALNEVIPGWTEGIQKINKGGKIRLYIPPQLGYGEEAKPGIPPSSTLVFDVELIDVKAPAAAPAPAAVNAPGGDAGGAMPAAK